MKKGFGKAAACAALCAGLVFGGVPASAAEIPAHIVLDGILQTGLYAQPYVENGVTMVGLRDIGNMYGATYGFSGRQVSVRFGTKVIIVEDMSSDALVNYDPVKMPAAAVVRNGHVMIPLRFASQTFGMTVKWDAANKAVRIDSKAADYAVMELPAYEVENQEAYTFAEALAIMNESSSKLKDLEYAFENFKDDKKDLDEKVKDVYSNQNNRTKNNWSMPVIELLRSQRTLENQMLTMQINMKQIKDGNEYNLRSALTAIEETRLDIYVLEQSIAQGEKNLESSELKLSLGLETEANVKAERLNLEQQKSNLQNLLIKKSGNQLALNSLLLLTQDKNAIITDFDETKATAYEADMEAFIAEKKESAPSVKLSFFSYDNAAYKQWTYTDLLFKNEQDKREKEKEPTKNEKDMENDVASKERELADTRAALDKSVRNAYNNIKQLEENYTSLQITLQKDIDNYERAVTSYLTGVGILATVDQAKLGILSTEISIYKNRINYATATYALVYQTN